MFKLGNMALEKQKAKDAEFGKQLVICYPIEQPTLSLDPLLSATHGASLRMLYLSRVYDNL